MRGCFLVVTCEHASRAVPAGLRACFRSADARVALASHRGWDIGVGPIFRALAAGADFACAGAASRLVVDLNRSPHHRALFSEFTRPLGRRERDEILVRHYLPYRERVVAEIAKAIGGGRDVLHVSVHTFTPVFGGRLRDVDIGVLYDPSCAAERALAGGWIAALAGRGHRLRRNQPYRGTADGLVTALRKRFPAGRYRGLELEVSQAIAGPRVAAEVAGALATARNLLGGTGKAS